MIPELGRACDICPSRHYLLTCSCCDYSWDEPPFPAEFICPKCGAEVSVSDHDHAVWETFGAPAADKVAGASGRKLWLSDRARAVVR